MKSTTERPSAVSSSKVKTVEISQRHFSFVLGQKSSDHAVGRPVLIWLEKRAYPEKPKRYLLKWNQARRRDEERHLCLTNPEDLGIAPQKNLYSKQRRDCPVKEAPIKRCKNRETTAAEKGHLLVFRYSSLGKQKPTESELAWEWLAAGARNHRIRL